MEAKEFKMSLTQVCPMCGVFHKITSAQATKCSKKLGGIWRLHGLIRSCGYYGYLAECFTNLPKGERIKYDANYRGVVHGDPKIAWSLLEKLTGEVIIPVTYLSISGFTHRFLGLPEHNLMSLPFNKQLQITDIP